MYACVHGESRRVVTPLVRSTTLLLPPLLPPLLSLLPLLPLLFSKTFGRWAARPFGHLRTSTHDMLRRAREWQATLPVYPGGAVRSEAVVRSQRSWRRALARRPKHHSGLEVGVKSCIRHAAPTGGWITRGEVLICATDE